MAKDSANKYAEFSHQPDWVEQAGRGGWFPDGAFDPSYDYWRAASGSLTRAIRAMVFLRRHDPDFSPRRAALLVESRGFQSAFPRRESWLEYAEAWQWPGVAVSTSADAAVEYAGSRDSSIHAVETH